MLTLGMTTIFGNLMHLLLTAAFINSLPVESPNNQNKESVVGETSKHQGKTLEVDINEWPIDARGDIVQLWPETEFLSNEVMRNALKTSAENRWTEFRDENDDHYIVPFEITGNFSEHEKEIIIGAMESIANNTCVKFRPRKSELEWVDLQTAPFEGCYTMVGRLPGANVVMLETGSARTCATHSTVVHELLHKLGLWHEQSRYDRDDAILVHYENIPRLLWPQFRRVSTNVSHVYGVKYDYLSVMHYGKTAGSISRDKLAMETKDPDYQDKIGKVKDASSGDYHKICSVYGCKRCMGEDFKINPDDLIEKRQFKFGACSFPLVPSERDTNCKPGGKINPIDYPYSYEVYCCEVPEAPKNETIDTVSVSRMTSIEDSISRENKEINEPWANFTQTLIKLEKMLVSQGIKESVGTGINSNHKEKVK